MPLYWRPLKHVPALEVLSHRVVWSLVFVGIMLLLRRRGGEVLATLKDPRRLRTLAGSAALIGANWGIFIWAVSHDLVLQTSLGYFINPLMSVALGTLVLRERLNRLQMGALVLAVAGVLTMAFRAGEVPWIALALALTFAIYGLIRKTAPVDSLIGLSVESLLLAPLAIGYVIWLGAHGEGAFLRESRIVDLVLLGAGPVTALPLLWFAHGARRLNLSTIGILQYLAPTGQFLVAVFVNDEPFTTGHQLGFALIWAGLALYSRGALVARRAP